MENKVSLSFKFLCFDFEGVRICFVALVFGLLVPYFLQIIKVPLSFSRLKGAKNSAWLDDILLVASSDSISYSSLPFSSSCRFHLGYGKLYSVHSTRQVKGLKSSPTSLIDPQVQLSL